MTVPDPAGALTWWECEPRRLERDRQEIAQHFPGLQWTNESAGGWSGTLPRWPFDRPEPDGLAALVGETGLLVDVVYSHAYPMVPPSVRPLDPAPQLAEWTVHAWHVNGDGSLCLLQADSLWSPRGSIVDLLLKAAGWRVEYALMKMGAIAEMSLSGLVSDDGLDGLVTEVARLTLVQRS